MDSPTAANSVPADDPPKDRDTLIHEAMVETIDTLFTLEKASQPDMPAQDLPAMAAARILSIYIPEDIPKTQQELAQQLDAVADGLSQCAFRALQGVRLRAAMTGVTFDKAHEEAAYLRNMLRRVADELVVHLRQTPLEVAG